MAMRAVSKTVNPGSNPGSPAFAPGPQLPDPERVSRSARRQGRAKFLEQMTQTRKPGWRRPLAAIGAVAAAVAVAAASFALASEPTGAEVVARGGAPCPLASEPAAQSSTKDMRNSVRCLINQERGVHGFGKLKRDAALQKAAQRHTKAMVSTGCLAHRCPDEANLETRLRDAGYFDGAQSWRYRREHRLRAERRGDGRQLARQSSITESTSSTRTFDDIGVGVSKKRVSGRCMQGLRDLHRRLRSARPVDGRLDETSGRPVNVILKAVGGQCRFGKSMANRLCETTALTVIAVAARAGAARSGAGHTVRRQRRRQGLRSGCRRRTRPS